VNNVFCPKAYVNVVTRHNVKGLHPLPSVPVAFVRCPPLKFQAPLKISTNAVECKQSMPVCLSGGEARAGNGNQEPLWKSFGKAIENLGKKPSVEDLLKQQIEKREYYDEEGFSGVLDETVQVILATFGFIFLYMYIINGAEMTRLAKDYIKYVFGGKKSIRLSRALYQWESFCKNLTEKKETDRYWLERAIIRTPTWWDSPEKYKRILKAYAETPTNSMDYEQDQEDDYGHNHDDSMSEDF
uniref:Uncharacterized protein n=1 Tax=Chenopodium quinoa TaxID=63459 RepID=A0A803L3R6_CHEQI